jgi:hypothetical protein
MVSKSLAGTPVVKVDSRAASSAGPTSSRDRAAARVARRFAVSWATADIPSDTTTYVLTEMPPTVTRAKAIETASSQVLSDERRI